MTRSASGGVAGREEAVARRRSEDEVERLRREVARGAGVDVIERLADLVRERESAARPRSRVPVLNRYGCTFLCATDRGTQAYATLTGLRRFLKTGNPHGASLKAAMTWAESARPGSIWLFDSISEPDVEIVTIAPGGDVRKILHDAYEDQEELDAAQRREDLAARPRSACPVEFSVEDGQLHIRLDPEAREEVEELLDKPVDQAFAELIEYHLANGWTLLDPEDVGALTASPILSEEVQYDEDGNIASVGRVYWYPEYQVKSEIEELLEDGEVVFRGQP